MVTLRQGKLLKEIASDDAVFSIQCCKFRHPQHAVADQ